MLSAGRCVGIRQRPDSSAAPAVPARGHHVSLGADNLCPMAYSQPHYYVSIQKPPSNGLAVTALVLGVVAIVTGVWTPIPFLGIAAAMTAFIPAVLAVIFGHIGLNRARSIGGTGRSQALAGLWTGYITLGIILVTCALWFLFIVGAGATSAVTSA